MARIAGLLVWLHGKLAVIPGLRQTTGKPATAQQLAPTGTQNAQIECVWRRVEVSTVLLLALAGCGGQSTDHAAQSSPEETPKQAKAQAHSDDKVRVQMKGVDLVVDPPVVLEVRSLRGEFVPTREGEPPWFD